MKPEDNCQCKCQDNEVWNLKTLECQKPIRCPKKACPLGKVRTEFDCQCKDDEKACKKEFPGMKWVQIDGKGGKCIPTLPCEIEIRCPHWMTLGDCRCDDITDKQKCLSIDGNDWDATNEKCIQEELIPIVCVKEPCLPVLAAMIPETFAQKAAKCIDLECEEGERRNFENCECQNEKDFCLEREPFMKWMTNKKGKGRCMPVAMCDMKCE